MDIQKKEPKVSVCVLAYNHEKYIRECLQSLVDQETNFKFEIIVADDCSTDGTGAIIHEFCERYPGLVRPIFHATNVGPTRNYATLHMAACGLYIADLDGDDCALPGKLQAQADVLDDNPDIAFCAHAVKVLGTEKLFCADQSYPEKGSINDLLRYGTYFVESSVMCRRESEPQFRRFIGPNAPQAVDYFFHMERASKGGIYFDRRPLGCYRIHAQGISKNPRYRQIIEDCYEAAFDRALELNVPKELVQTARLKRRMSFAVDRYLFGDVDGYKSKIKISKNDIKFASRKHLVLHWTRFLPSLVGILARFRKSAARSMA